jgi:hypothetical protein
MSNSIPVVFCVCVTVEVNGLIDMYTKLQHENKYLDEEPKQRDKDHAERCNLSLMTRWNSRISQLGSKERNLPIALQNWNPHLIAMRLLRGSQIKKIIRTSSFRKNKISLFRFDLTYNERNSFICGGYERFIFGCHKGSYFHLPMFVISLGYLYNYKHIIMKSMKDMVALK